MKRNWKDVALGLTIAGAVGTMAFSASAAAVTKQISATYNNIQIVVDGVKVTPKDANGKTVEPFVYEGTTYLPVRAMGEAIGKQVTWDGNTQTVYLGQVPGESNYLVDVCPPYNSKDCTVYKGADGEFFKMAGKKYTNGIMLIKKGYAIMNTDGKYNSMTFTVGFKEEYSSLIDGTLEVYLNGKYSQSIELNAEDVPHEVTIPLNGALSVKLALTYEGATWPGYGLADIVLN